MSIGLHRTFRVRRPVEEVWDFLTDPRRLADCMPGAHLLDVSDDSFGGEVTLRFGPLGTTVSGRASFRDMSREERSVLLAATAAETESDGAAVVRMRSRLSTLATDATLVDVRLGVRLAGRFDGPILRRVLGGAAELLLRRFVSCVRARLEAEEAHSGAPHDGGTVRPSSGSPALDRPD